MRLTIYQLQSHFMAKRDKPQLEARICRRGIKLLFYCFMQSADMLKNGGMLPRMSKRLALIILCKARFKSIV